MQLPSTLAWLVDAAAASPDADRFLADLGARLIDDGLPLAGGALSMAAPHPIIARRAWLWRSDTGAVIEALGFAAALPSAGPPGNTGRAWLAGLGGGPAHEDVVGPGPDGPSLGWIGPRPFTSIETDRLSEAARFAAAPLAALLARATLTAASRPISAGAPRRGCSRALRRGFGETIRAALLCADLRGFTALSEDAPPAAVITALDAWFDRIAGAVHAFGGEVLKFLGDGMLAIFPVAEGSPGAACDAALSAVAAARAGWRISTQGGKRRACRPAVRRGRAYRIRSCGAILARPTGWISPRSVPPSTWSVGWRDCAGRSAGRSWFRAPSLPKPERRYPVGHACTAWHSVPMRRLHRLGELSVRCRKAAASFLSVQRLLRLRPRVLTFRTPLESA
jgi:hypothetical protein